MVGRMSITIKIVCYIAIAFVAVCSLVGLLILLVVYLLPQEWRNVLRDYQSLASSMVAIVAAVVALCSVWLTIRVQTENVTRQLAWQQQQLERDIAERRSLEDRRQAILLRQVASGFVSEINIIMSAFGDEWQRVAEKAIVDVGEAKRAHEANGLASVKLVISRPAADFTSFFRANVREVGQFPQPLPQDMLTFYGIYVQLQDNLGHISRAADEDFRHMETSSLEAALRMQLQQLNNLRAIGVNLIPQLQRVANQPTP
jgi:hypothetical protein